MPLPRMTTRRWMITVAVIALVLGGGQRTCRALRLAHKYRFKAEGAERRVQLYGKNVSAAEDFFAYCEQHIAKLERSIAEAEQNQPAEIAAGVRERARLRISRFRTLMNDFDNADLKFDREEVAFWSEYHRDHDRLATERERAAWLPWLPVPADPQPPQ